MMRIPTASAPVMMPNGLLSTQTGYVFSRHRVLQPADDLSPSPPPTFRSSAAFAFMNARSSITTKLSIVATMNGNAWNINEGPKKHKFEHSEKKV